MNIRPAQAILNELQDGLSLKQLAQAFHDAIAAVREHGKPATVTLLITVGTLEGQHHLIEPPIIMTAEVSTKLPKAKAPATIFFVDQDGNATRNQTRQQDLGLTVAAAAVPAAAQQGGA